MSERKILLTIEAIYDIANIACYIEDNFGINRADRFQQDIHEQLQLLAFMGEAFSKTSFFYKEWEIYKKSFPPSIIFYIVKTHEIHILRVLRAETNWQKTIKSQHYTY